MATQGHIVSFCSCSTHYKQSMYVCLALCPSQRYRRVFTQIWWNLPKICEKNWDILFLVMFKIFGFRLPSGTGITQSTLRVFFCTLRRCLFRNYLLLATLDMLRPAGGKNGRNRRCTKIIWNTDHSMPNQGPVLLRQISSADTSEIQKVHYHFCLLLTWHLT